MTDDWRFPYRSADESGSPETAGAVGWAWLYETCRHEHGRNPAGLELDQAGHALYRDRRLVAAYFIIRDPLNFSVLIRWRAPRNALDELECPHWPCAHTRESFAKQSTCGYGGCPWGGDF